MVPTKSFNLINSYVLQTFQTFEHGGKYQYLKIENCAHIYTQNSAYNHHIKIIIASQFEIMNQTPNHKEVYGPSIYPSCFNTH